MAAGGANSNEAMERRQIKWTPEKDEILKSRYPKSESLCELAKELGCDRTALYNRAFILGIRREKKKEFKSTKYTSEQFEFVRKHYPDMSGLTLSVCSGVSMRAIRRWQQKFGWHKSDCYKRECKEFLLQQGKNPQERWRKKHPDKVARYAQSYRQRHPERVAESKRRYREKHKA